MRLFFCTIWVYVSLVISAFLLMAMMPILIATATIRRLPSTHWARQCCWLYGRITLFIIRPVVRVTPENPDVLHNAPATIIAANHQSAFDLFTLSAQNAINISTLVRSWPFRMLFFFRPIMRRANYIETETAHPETILAACRSELALGNHILGFPEGTRSINGELGRFRSGLFKLAVETGTAIRPLVIHSTHTVLPKGSFWFRPGTVHVEILDPVSPDAFLHEPIPHGAMRRAVRQRIATALARGPHRHGGEHERNRSCGCHAAPTTNAVAAPYRAG